MSIWAIACCTVLLSITAAVALRADARLRADGISEQDPNWLTVLFLPGAGSRAHAVFNHSLLLLPILIGVSILWLWPLGYLQGIVAELNTSQADDFPRKVQSFAVELKGLAIPLGPLLYGIENRIIRSANQYFLTAYGTVFALNVIMFVVVIRLRRRILRGDGAVAGPSTAADPEPASTNSTQPRR
ncbi:hypothetical protein ABIF70_005207 [Bradyrhizobium japonicum]